MEQDIYQLLHRSFDQELTKEEEALLQQALENSAELRKEKAQLQATRELFSNWTVDPDPSFSEAVMLRIENMQEQIQDTFSRSIIRLFPRLAAACIIFILVFLLNIYLTDGSLSSEAILGLDSLYPEDAELSELGF